MLQSNQKPQKGTSFEDEMRIVDIQMSNQRIGTSRWKDQSNKSEGGPLKLVVAWTCTELAVCHFEVQVGTIFVGPANLASIMFDPSKSRSKSWILGNLVPTPQNWWWEYWGLGPTRWVLGPGLELWGWDRASASYPDDTHSLTRHPAAQFDQDMGPNEAPVSARC